MTDELTPYGQMTWEGTARMAAARLHAHGTGRLSPVDREALHRHPELLPVGVLSVDQFNPAGHDTRRAVDRSLTQAGAEHPGTSHQAAARARPRSGSDRLRVLEHIETHGVHGATDDELEVALGLPHQTASARRNGLVSDGWLVDGGERRPTRSGAMAIVWVLTPLR